MKNIVWLGFVMCLGCVWGGCKKQTPEVHIGFSQCTGGEWREQMNRQMRSEINFYENTRLEIRNADGKVKQQIADIHYFIEKKVDLLIISPFEDKALVEAFNRIDFGGIPILLVDRNLSSNKHVAYVGASNLEVGKIAARFALKQLGARSARVLLIRGYEKSSVTFEREEGFLQTVKSRPDIEVISIDAGKDVDGKDLSETRRIIHENRHLLEEVDAVYAFNDAMAMIASEEARKMNLKKEILFIGVDGRMGYDGGIEAVRNGILSASIVYPTGGDKAIEVAMKIIRKIPVQKYISLPLTLIEPVNVEPYYQQSLILQEYANKIEVLHTGKTELLNRFVQQQRMLERTLATGSLLLSVLIAAALLFYRKKNAGKQEEVTNPDGNEPDNEPDASERFKAEIEALMEKHYAEYDFSMSVLVSELALSRMQLYRQFKFAFNETPNNYIRKYRLRKAVELIKKGERSFSEIAYQVGYNSPAYFTKCFREEFRCTPSEYLAKEKEK